MIMSRATFLLASFCLMFLGAKGQECPPGFYTRRKSCYWFSKIHKTYASARSICDSLGSHLAYVTSYDEDHYLIGIASRYGYNTYYLGGNDFGHEGTWMWEDSKPLTYTNWYPGNPSNTEGREHCLTLHHGSYGYHWNDINCDRRVYFICERGH